MISEFGKRVRASWRLMKMPSVDSRNLLRFGEGYLEPLGWFDSGRHQYASMPGGTEPCPWFTYPAIRALPRLAQPDTRVMEYGGGQSTLWWASRVAEVVSVDHDPKWHAHVTSRSDVPMLLRAADEPLEDALEAQLAPFYELGLEERLSGTLEERMVAGVATRPFHSYAAEMFRHPKGHFDVAVVDGMARVLCAWVAAQCVSERGVIVLDNAEHEYFRDATALLEDLGWIGVPHWGPGPVVRYEFCTTFFVRDLEAFRRAPIAAQGS